MGEGEAWGTLDLSSGEMKSVLKRCLELGLEIFFSSLFYFNYIFPQNSGLPLTHGLYIFRRKDNKIKYTSLAFVNYFTLFLKFIVTYTNNKTKKIVAAHYSGLKSDTHTDAKTQPLY